MRRSVAGVALLVTMAAPLRAADYVLPPVATPAVNPYSFLSEARVGFLFHSLYDPEYGSADINAEVLFAKPLTTDNWLLNYFIPRVHLGGNVNLDGKTSDVYTGVTWSFPLYKQVFGEASFGGDYNDGTTGKFPPPGRNAVGCAFNFRESVTIGYHLTEHWNVMSFIEHFSNAGLCAHNAGVTNAGARLGYVF